MAVFSENRKARFNYEILEQYEAGIELLGYEVPAIRKGLASLDGTHATVRGGEAYLIGVGIPPLQPKNTADALGDIDPTRNRRLLFSKKEIAELAKRTEQKGLTLVPLSLYSKGRKIKVSIALVRGKKEFDKRETIKRREADRDIRRTLKDQ